MYNRSIHWRDVDILPSTQFDRPNEEWIVGGERSGFNVSARNTLTLCAYNQNGRPLKAANCSELLKYLKADEPADQIYDSIDKIYPQHCATFKSMLAHFYLSNLSSLSLIYCQLILFDQTSSGM